MLWLLGGIFTPAGDMPDALAAISRKLPSSGILEIGDSVARGVAVPASASALLAAWTAASGVLAALAWRRLDAARGSAEAERISRKTTCTVDAWTEGRLRY